MAYMKGTAASQSKFPFSLLHTPYANEAYELMHDPIRIITLPAGLKAGIICGVAYGGTEEHNIGPTLPSGWPFIRGCSFRDVRTLCPQLVVAKLLFIRTQPSGHHCSVTYRCIWLLSIIRQDHS